MSEQSLTEMLNATELDPNDPLAQPAAQLKEPSFPVLREGAKRLVLKAISLHRNDDGNEQVRLKLVTTEPDMDTEGRATGAGFSFNDTIFATPNQYSTRKEIAEELGMMIKAFLGRDSQETIVSVLRNPTVIIDKVADTMVKVQTNKKTGRTNNTVSRWIVSKA